MTKVVISQPMYYPWAGFMAQLSLADVVIWLDDAQFSKGSFTNRIQVKMPTGVKWMSIPLAGKGSFQLIKDLEANGNDWISGHRSMLQQSLKGQPNCSGVLDIYDETPRDSSLFETLVGSMELPAQAMGILPKQRFRSSSMEVEGSSWERVLKLVQAVGGTEYITGHGAASYLDHIAFEEAGVTVKYMMYNPVPWQQMHGSFTPYVTILDMLSTVSVENAVRHLSPEMMEWRQFLKNKGIDS